MNRGKNRSIGMRGAGLAAACLAVMVLAVSASAENRSYADIYGSGQNKACDTLYLGDLFQIRIWIENDIPLGGFNFPVHLSSDDSLAWFWRTQTEYALLPGRYATYVPGSRLDPPENMGMGGVFTFETGLPDWLCIYTLQEKASMPDGSSKGPGLVPGPLQHMLSMHIQLSCTTLTPGYVGDVCMDNASIYPSCTYGFADYGGLGVPFTCNLPQCWPVVVICGNSNGDDAVDIGDAVFIVNYLLRSGRSPVPWALGDPNGDSYISIGDAVYLITYIFKDGPAPLCGAGKQ